MVCAPCRELKFGSFYPYHKEIHFSSNHSTKSDCISKGAANKVSRVRCNATEKVSLWREVKTEIGGGEILGRAIDPHQPLMKGEEESSDGAGLAVEYQGTVLPPEAADFDENPFLGSYPRRCLGARWFLSLWQFSCRKLLSRH